MKRLTIVVIILLMSGFVWGDEYLPQPWAENNSMWVWEPSEQVQYNSDAEEYIISDTLIQKLADSGRICEVIGHKWDIQYSLTTFTGVDGRTCVICGKHQIQKTIWGDE